MKPTVNIETKEKVTMKVETEHTIQQKPSTKWKVIGVLGISAMIMIIGATVLGIFVGKNITGDTYKEAWVTYRNTDTNVVIRERYILQGLEVAVIKPGEMSAIFDMNKNHLVMQIDDLKTNDTDDCMCMVFDMDRLTRMAFEDVNVFLNQTYINVVQNLTFTLVVLQHTGQYMDSTDLSRKSREMCLGCKIPRMVATTSDGFDLRTRKRRESSRQINHYPKKGCVVVGEYLKCYETDILGIIEK